MKEINKENMEEIISKGDVVVDFWAPWCGPCRIFAPVFEEVSKEHPDITFAKLNTEEHGELAAEYNIHSIPTLIFFRDGKVLDKIPGARDKQQFKDLLKEKFS